MTALVTASDPQGFLDGETWAFTLTLQQPDGLGPLDLTGSRLFVAFGTTLDATPIAACDSGASDGSLTLDDAAGGVASFTVTKAARGAWMAPRVNFGRLLPATVTGDLYRRVGSASGWEGLTRISFLVLPSLGVPAS